MNIAAPSRPKVMHVIAGLGAGGAETMLANLVTADRENAPEQVVVDLLSGGTNSQRIRDSGVPVREFGPRRRRPSLRMLLWLRQVIAEEKPDIVQSWMYHADLLAVLALSWSGRRRRTRLYWGVRCSDMDTARYGRILRLVVFACARLSSRPDAVVANSVTGQRVHERLGYRTKRFVVIDNGIDTTRFRPDPEVRREVREELGLEPSARVLILPARLDPMKDFGTFLDAMERLPDTICIIAGDGTQFLPERHNTIALGLRHDLPRLYAAADVVLSTSAFGEGFSNAIGEGMAAGLPAIATDVGDANRIIGDTGIVVPPSDPDALASAVRAMFVEPREMLVERGRRARARICEYYSLDRFVAKFDALHRESR